VNDGQWMDAMDQASKWVEAAAGYRRKALDAGFTTEASEQMAMDFHSMILSHVCAVHIEEED
jgi:hypothetical protein